MQNMRQPKTLEAAWDSVVPIMEILFHRSREGDVGFGNKEWMLCYTTIYNYCASSTTGPSATVVGASAAHNQGANKSNGEDLYDKLSEFVVAFCDKTCQELEAVLDEELLHHYNKRWTYFLFSRRVMSHTAEYINRQFVTREQDSHHRVLKLHDMAVFHWRENVFTPLSNKLIAQMLKLIKLDRDGDAINSSLVKGAVNSLALLGLYDDNDKGVEAERQGQDLSVYKKVFEAPFLEETAAYYLEESQRYISENAITDYMKQVERRVNEEEIRISKYLHESTRNRLIVAVCDKLIRHYIDRFNSEVKALYQSERHEDLHRMFKLLSRVENGINSLKKSLEEHVVAQGTQAVNKIGEISLSSEDSKRYVEVLLGVHKKYAGLVHSAFTDDVQFVESLDRACRTFVNNNAVTKASKSSRTPELLAKYCDSLLKRSSKNEDQQLEAIFVDIMIIFRYVDDKDVFEKFYKKFLANRLVGAKSVSDDAETSMISKLKAHCGNEYTSKLERMFRDIETSKSLSSKFKDHLVQSDSKLNLDFNVQVLTSNTWPFSVQFTLNLPSTLVHCIDRFTTFFNREHEGRKLQWLYQHCKGELKTLYTKKTHFLECNTIQMVTLLQFNEGLKQTRESLLGATGLDEKTLMPQLENLCKMKILLSKDGTYICNEKYNHKKIRVRIDQPVKSEQKAESDETHKTAEEDRKYVIQAVIVRIMKTRKTLTYRLLLQEVIDQVKNRFKPKVNNIKRNIDSLMEQEYLRRKEGDRDTLEYLA